MMQFLSDLLEFLNEGIEAIFASPVKTIGFMLSMGLFGLFLAFAYLAVA